MGFKLFKHDEELKDTPLLFDIKEITLLTRNEAETVLTQEQRCKGFKEMTGFWWLRSSSGESNQADIVDPRGNIDCLNVGYSFGIVPAMKVDNFASLKLGDKFTAGGETWIVVSDNIAVCDNFIGMSEFRLDHTEPSSNVYAMSDIKKGLDAWVKEKGILTGQILAEIRGQS